MSRIKSLRNRKASTFAEMKNVREKLADSKLAAEDREKLKGDFKALEARIALTKDMLANAFNNNYDVAVLVTGDGDYVPVVEEVKRLGKTVYLTFFEDKDGGLNKELRLASDKFFRLRSSFIQAWADRTSAPAEEDVVEQPTT
jgi:uncharacterized LabA/DUF88 family protein